MVPRQIQTAVAHGQSVHRRHFWEDGGLGALVLREVKDRRERLLEEIEGVHCVERSHQDCVTRVEAVSEKLQGATRLRLRMFNIRLENVGVADQTIVGPSAEQAAKVVHVYVDWDESHLCGDSLGVWQLLSTWRHLI